MTKIIGIDPGLASTGIGIVSGTARRVEQFSFGCIRTAKETGTAGRLDRIFTRLLGILNDERPDLMVIEDIFSLGKYPKSGINLGKVSGVVQLAGSRTGVPAMEIPVREAKQILTGNGNASKDQLEKSVRRILNRTEPIRPDHASDALAMALIGLYRYRPGR